MSKNLDALLSPVTVSRVKTAATGGAPRVLTIDIESLPHTAYVYDTFNVRYISAEMVKEPGRMISWAAKWLDSKNVIYRSEYHHGTDQMLADLHALLDQADIVVTYNGGRFDLPYINGTFLLHGLTPPSPYKSVDLYTAMRRMGKAFTHKKLGVVCEMLGIGGKLEHGGFTMWKQILENNDPKAWKQERKYNIQDIIITEQLFWRLLPWLKGLPHRGLWSGVERCCPACGSEDLLQAGWHQTAITRYAKLQCQDCGTWSRATYIRTRPITRHIA